FARRLATGALRGEVDLAARRIVALDGELAFEKKGADGATLARAKTKVTIGAAQVARDEGAAFATLATADAGVAEGGALYAPRVTSSDDDRAAREELLAGRTLDGLLAALASSDADESAQAEIGLFTYLGLHPEACADVGRAIARSPREGNVA